MPLLHHVKRHYNDLCQRMPEAVHHRDSLMLHHNTIKRRIITLAACCALGAKADKAGLVSAFVHDGVDPTRKKRARQPSLRVLDLASGRGGDVYKWFHAGATDYTGVDVSEESCDEARRRLLRVPGPMAANVYALAVGEFFSAHDVCEGVFDVISLQFALNYIVDDRQSLHELFSTCKRHLAHGGVITGTMVDSVAAAAELGRPGNAGDYFKLTPVTGQRGGPDELGYMYSFFLHNAVGECVECAVPWASVETALRENDLQVDYHAGFADLPTAGVAVRLHEMQRRLSRIYVAFQISHASGGNS